MKYVTIPETTLETLIEGLESVLKVCYNVDYSSTETENSAPYAIGYTKASVQSVLENLKQIKSQEN
jgi:hypothetical protein